MKALIDADTPIFAAALSANDKELWVATSRLESMIYSIFKESKADEYVLFVSGSSNFRKELDISYKANRTQDDPIHRKACREFLIQQMDAISAEHCEADDFCGIYQSEDTIICGIDKDLLQIPGKHFRWQITRGTKVVREAEFVEVSEIDGLRSFYRQMLTGDTSDNIKGVDKIGEVKSAKLINHLTNEKEMKDLVKDLYNDDDRFYNNANLLWIMRGFGETYTVREEIKNEI